MLLDTHFTDAELHKLTMLYPKVDTCWWVAKLTAVLQQLDHSFRAHHAPQQAIEEQGRSAEAVIVKRQFESFWRNADVKLSRARL